MGTGPAIRPARVARRLHHLLAAVLVLAALASGSVAHAQAPTPKSEPPAAGSNPLIERGETLYEELRFEEALQVLSAALVRPDNTDSQRAMLYRLLALTYLALGREEEAAGAYRSLLALRPDHAPSDALSPRFRDFFGSVRTQWEAEGRPGLRPPAPVEIEHSSPARAEPGERVDLTGQLDDPERRASGVVLAYRRGTEEVFQRVDARLRDGDFAAFIPAEHVRPPLVEYYFEAMDARGLPIASRGDVAAPLRIAVPEPSSSVFKKWWFWVAAAAVVGGATTAGVLLAGDDGGSQGTLVVSVE
jgi:tetratricopeptide (TPR) repeat protein